MCNWNNTILLTPIFKNLSGVYDLRTGSGTISYKLDGKQKIKVIMHLSLPSSYHSHVSSSIHGISPSAAGQQFLLPFVSTFVVEHHGLLGIFSVADTSPKLPKQRQLTSFLHARQSFFS